MTTLDDALAAEQEALQDAATAKAAAEQLEQRLEGGDATVTAEQLDDAHRFAKWARSHAKGVTARREKAAADAAIEAAKAAIDQAANVAEFDEQIVTCWREAIAAVSALVDVALKRDQVVRENHTLLETHRAKLARIAGVDAATLGLLPSKLAGNGEAGYRIPARGIDVVNVRTVEVVAEAVASGVAGRLNLDETTMAHRHPLVGSSLAAKVTGWDAAARALAGA